MKLFLSSYRFGGHSDAFVELTGPPSDLAVIANASDAWPRAARESSLTSEFVPLRALGYRPAELDLREYVGRPAALERALDDFGAVWVRGAIRSSCALNSPARAQTRSSPSVFGEDRSCTADTARARVLPHRR